MATIPDGRGRGGAKGTPDVDADSKKDKAWTPIEGEQAGKTLIHPAAGV